MFNFHRDPLTAYPSEHRFHGAEQMLEVVRPTPVEPSDGEAMEPAHIVVDGFAERTQRLAEDGKERAVVHYKGLAIQAAREAQETNVGHALLAGDIDASGAVVALDVYEEQLAIAGYTRVFDSGMGGTIVNPAIL
jgi:hypothetical protein